MTDAPKNPDWIGELIQGGLPQIALGKPIAKAIGRLIGTAADIPAAVLEGVASDIRSNSEARDRLRKAIAAAAAKEAVTNPKFVDRAIEHWLDRQIREQKNREAVAKKALEYLAEKPASLDAEAPSDDFLNLVDRYSSSASSNELRDLFARILAGECRAKGTFSLAALHVLSVMDSQLAEAIQRASSWLQDGDFIVFRNDFTQGRSLGTLGLLSDFGLVRIGQHTRPLKFDGDGRAGFVYGLRAIIAHGPANAEMSMPVVPVTPVGKQVFSLVDPDWDEQSFRSVANAIQSLNGVGKITQADILSQTSGHAEVGNERELDF